MNDLYQSDSTRLFQESAVELADRLEQEVVR